jgi:hypothetical protein
MRSIAVIFALTAEARERACSCRTLFTMLPVFALPDCPSEGHEGLGKFLLRLRLVDGEAGGDVVGRFEVRANEVSYNPVYHSC